MINPREIDGVICYWEYVPPTKKFTGGDWKLVESYPVDDDLHPLVEVKHTSDFDFRFEWEGFTNKLSKSDEYEPIMGRAVTYWNFNGVRLLDLNPPDEFPHWISPLFYDRIRERDDWALLFHGGPNLSMGTADEAQRVLYHYFLENKNEQES